MAKKKPVVLRPFKAPRYSFGKLRVCKRCGRFTALSEKRCLYCGRATLVSVEERAASLAGRRMTVSLLIAALLTVAAVYFAGDSLQRALCAAGGLALLAALFAAQRKARPTENLRSLDELLGRNIAAVKEGLEINRQEAVSVLRENDTLAYEKLREIAVLLRGDRVARQRIALLHGFRLRKDMDLEMEQLLLRDFEPLLAEYIGEVARLRRDLIKDRTLRYVQRYEAQILEMKDGSAILAAVAGAAVRMKRYALLYSSFISRYAHSLPRDRFLRLHQLISAYPHESWNGLDVRAQEIREAKYRWDPDFGQAQP
ncbi:hypothetical protein SAMN04487895_11357 [Paenibacillus sophorae]|uniref:Uncharacterized protein n=1 Tax=Paenibacillus sophorae TaxID=1333845 RepID=A0A1H8T621_9BACL|nr:hypothetical protein [Paenibacillus sophorae]QWU17102.1 hypothetical protein KP014_08010 [Paenibacillus sophorae]SEO86156.1 hypothetical protein SAMN04487895_11357 [Paenibacillus sophorae]